MIEAHEQPINVDLLRIQQYVDRVGNYSETAIRTKMSKGVWRNGHEYFKGVGTGVLISISGVERWARQTVSTLTQESGAKISKSTSGTTGKFFNRL